MEANFERAEESAKTEKSVAAEARLKFKEFSAGEISGAESLYTVSILFSPEVAAHIPQVEWFYNQRLVMHENGAAELRFNVHSLDGLDGWVLGWGAAATVLKPQELRAKIIEAAEAILKKHLDEPEDSAFTVEDA